MEAEQARQEAEHWAWALSSAGEFDVRRPFDGRWEVGVRDVRLVGVAVESFEDGRDLWVGIHWTSHGFPDPECVLLEGHSSALEWVVAPVAGGTSATTIHKDPWLLSATFDNDASKPTALRSMVVSFSSKVRPAPSEVCDRAPWNVRSIHPRLSSRSARLARDGIEEIVEREWGALSVGTDVLLESSGNWRASAKFRASCD